MRLRIFVWEGRRGTEGGKQPSRHSEAAARGARSGEMHAAAVDVQPLRDGSSRALPDDRQVSEP